jgi:hypothetical protein
MASFSGGHSLFFAIFFYNRTMKIKDFLLLYTMVLVGCSSILKEPGPRFSTSETSGMGSGGAEVGRVAAHRLQPSTDFRLTPIDHVAHLDHSSSLNFHNKYGLFESVDIEFDFGPDMPAFLNLKFQFLGASESTAKAWNFSISGKIGYGIFVAAGEIPVPQISGDSQTQREFIINSGTTNYELLMGIRVMDPLLIYAGYFMMPFSYSNTFKEGVRDTIKHSGDQTGYHLGVNYGVGPFRVKYNMAKVTMSLKTSNKEITSTMWGLSVGVFF